MWFDRKPTRVANAPAGARSPTELGLAELLATQPKRQRGSLAPGERYPTGNRPGRRRAQGTDLDSIGPYVPGDDLRSMDWRATARTGRAQMKRFVAESHLARMLIVDMRAHMFFATSTHPMAKTAALVASELAWESHSLHEPIGVMVLPDLKRLEPRRGRGHVLRVLDLLVECYARQIISSPADSGLTAGDALRAAASSLRQGDEISFVSDFGEPDDDLHTAALELSAARTLRAVLIEDAIFTNAVPSGRYPLRSRASNKRAVAIVSSGMETLQRETIARLRQSTHTLLSRKGWHVSHAAVQRFAPQPSNT